MIGRIQPTNHPGASLCYFLWIAARRLATWSKEIQHHSHWSIIAPSKKKHARNLTLGLPWNLGKPWGFSRFLWISKLNESGVSNPSWSIPRFQRCWVIETTELGARRSSKSPGKIYIRCYFFQVNGVSPPQKWKIRGPPVFVDAL